MQRLNLTERNAPPEDHIRFSTLGPYQRVTLVVRIAAKTSLAHLNLCGNEQHLRRSACPNPFTENHRLGNSHRRPRV